MSSNLSITTLTVDQLKKELQNYGLDIKGRKGELLARLVDHLDGDEAEAEEQEAADDAENEEEKLAEEGDDEKEMEAEMKEKDDEKEAEMENREEIEEGAEAEYTEADKEEGSVVSGNVDQALEDRLLDEHDEEMEGKEMETLDDLDEKKSKDGSQKEGEDEKPEDKIRDVRIDEDDFEKLTRGQLLAEAVQGRDKLVLFIANISPKDLATDLMASILEKCAAYNYHRVPILGEEGASYIEITFISEAPLAEAEEELKKWNEDIKMTRVKKNQSTTDTLRELTARSAVLGQANRTVCVLGVTKTMTESELHEIFPGLLSVTGEDKNGSSTGRRFIEFATEEAAAEAVENNQQVVMDKHRLCVFMLSNAASGASITPEEGKPLTPMQMHKLFDQWMDMRMEITKQWSEQYPDDLIKLVKEHDAQEEKFREDEKLKEKLHLPGSEIWRRILARRTARAALDIYNVRSRRLCRLQTDTLFDLLNKRIKRMQEVRDERSNQRQSGGSSYRGKPQGRQYGGDTRNHGQWNHGQKGNSDNRRSNWSPDQDRGAGQKRHYQERDRYDDYGKRQRYDSRSGYGDSRDNRVDNPLYVRQQNQTHRRDTAASALDLLVGLSQMIGKDGSQGGGGRDQYSSGRDQHSSSYSQQHPNSYESSSNSHSNRSYQRQGGYSKQQSYRSTSGRNSGYGSSNWN